MLTGTAALGVLSLLRMSRIDDRSTELATSWLPSVEFISAVWANSAEIRGLQYRHIAAQDEPGRASAEKQLAEKTAELEANYAAYEQTITSEKERALATEFKQAFAAYMAHWATLQARSRLNEDSLSTAAMLGVGTELRDAMNKPLKALVTLNHDGGVASSAAAHAEYASAKVMVAITIIAVIAAGVFLAFAVGGRMSRVVSGVVAKTQEVQSQAIAALGTSLEALARGDLTATPSATIAPMGLTTADEFGALSRAIDGMITDLQRTLESYGQTQRNVAALVAQSRTIAQAAQAGDLAVRADTTVVEGSFREVIAGLNGTLEAVATPIAEMRAVMASVANRDLAVRMRGSYAGEYAAIQSDVNTALGAISDSLGAVRAAADQVASAGGQITSSAQLLASGASQQAASLEEVAASVSIVVSMGQQSASNAGEARSLAASARSDAQDGVARMERLTAAVNEIKQSSAQTAKIVRTIDEIAFQTNLLALNAAVEAARAGDAGRGFAVVAEEVRSLALRAAEAAKTTSGLIEQGQAAAERGVQLNDEVMQSLTRIGTQIVRVAEVTAEISASSEQQVDGVTQIRQAVDQINAVTQQVAANAEESASAATELDSQAQTLRDTVMEFRLSDRTAPHAIADRRPAGVGAGRPQPQRASAPRSAARRSPASIAAATIPFDDEVDGLGGF